MVGSGSPSGVDYDPTDFIGPYGSQGTAEFESHCWPVRGDDVLARESGFPASSGATDGVMLRVVV